MYGGGVILVSIIIELLEPSIRHALPSVVSKLYGVTLIPYLWMFLIAAFVAEYKEKILPLLEKYWIVFIVLLIIMRYILHWDIPMNTNYSLFGTVFLFCGLVGFAYQFPKWNIKTDISYGIYIYHMTVVNALMALGFTGQSWTLWIVVLLSCLLAWVSTKTIGKISIGRKQQIK